jgi:hypothetical protein
MALSLEVLPGDRIRIGTSIITVEEKSGRRSRLSIDSTDPVRHDRAGSKPATAPAPTPGGPPRLTRPRRP